MVEAILIIVIGVYPSCSFVVLGHVDLLVRQELNTNRD